MALKDHKLNPSLLAEDAANTDQLTRNLAKLANDPLDQRQYLPYPANRPEVGSLSIVRVPQLGKADGSFTLLLAQYDAHGWKCPRVWSIVRDVLAFRVLPDCWIQK